MGSRLDMAEIFLWRFLGRLGLGFLLDLRLDEGPDCDLVDFREERDDEEEDRDDEDDEEAEEPLFFSFLMKPRRELRMPFFSPSPNLVRSSWGVASPRQLRCLLDSGVSSTRCMLGREQAKCLLAAAAPPTTFFGAATVEAQSTGLFLDVGSAWMMYV
ncbi:hypothetical protein EGW08_014903 [Elysia chlorotica]|uniref:Peptidase A2 domain-containing protein n=1 Tax=Elysia chlorotica TaxID=188477 RepID=A0A433T6W7_ELYCH|nr:hypothetical protein EGW08_014903 [Elysia chlorotica]